MLLTLNDLQKLGKTLDDARQHSPGGRKSSRPFFKNPDPRAGQPDPDYEVFEGEGLYCLKWFESRPDGDDPRSVHGRSRLGVDPVTGKIACVACERGL